MSATDNNFLAAITALNNGGLILLHDDANRENEIDFVVLAKYTTPEIVNFIITQGKGLLCVAITPELAEKLDLPLLGSTDDKFVAPFTMSVDHIKNGSGISVKDRAQTIQAIADPNSKPEDFRRPGHVFPLRADPQGLIARQGHTEAAVELAKLCNENAAVICEMLDQDGAAMSLNQAEEFSRLHKLPLISVQQITDYLRSNLST